MVEVGVGVAEEVPGEGADADMSVCTQFHCIHTILFTFSFFITLSAFIRPDSQLHSLIQSYFACSIYLLQSKYNIIGK